MGPIAENDMQEPDADELLRAIMGMDAAAKVELLHHLRRCERGECSPEEAVAAFGRYAERRM